MADTEDELEREDNLSGPDKEPKSSRAYLAMIAAAEKDAQDYHDRADSIERLYGSMDKLANVARDREFQLFWANIQVLGPSVYSRPPEPVVVPRFQDRRPLYRTASELLERSAKVALELEDIDGIMRLVRDDLIILARGCMWVRYEKKSKDEPESACIEHVHRKDFLHETARNWKEVGWVAKRSWMTRKEMRKRFSSSSGKAYQTAGFERRKDENDQDDGRLKAPVWEIWHKAENRVVWVTEGVDKLLDDDKPHLSLEGFFPCPKPAYGTVQRGSLVPLPDMLFYKDQLEEINELTARIAALTEGVKIRGFYPAGSGEIADAIEAAIKSTSNNQILVPLTNMSSLGSGTFKDMIIWLPVDQIVAAIKELVELRRQLIEDVYQVTGLSDIMRGATEASETLGAQQLKSQYGSIRIRDRQEELVRIARDVVGIIAEIMSENFSGKTLLDMAQMDLPSDADVKRQEQEFLEQVRQVASDPRAQQLAAQNPDQTQQMKEQAAQKVEKIRQTVTIDAVMKLLRDQRTRPFALDIETDSTISPDENAQKQRATEYMTALTNYIGTAGPGVLQFPMLAPVFADGLRFVQQQFRVGRQMDQTIDEFVEQMKEMAKQPPPDASAGQAEAQKAQQAQMEAQMQAEQAKQQGEMHLKQADMQMKAEQLSGEMEMKRQQQVADLQAMREETQAKLLQMSHQATMNEQKHAQEMEMGALELQKLQAEISRIHAQAEGAAVAAAAKVNFQQPAGSA